VLQKHIALLPYVREARARNNQHQAMAAKEATVYILDLGRSMGKKRNGRDQTDLDWALEYVWDKITTTVSRRSFGDLVR
jgi:uncharacterized protein YgiB involved in biofilm formation